MIKKIWLDTMPILIVLCMFAFIFGVYYGLFEIPFIYKIEGTNAWNFDLRNYFLNLDTALVGFQELKLELNPLRWQDHGANMLQSQFWQDILNNLAYIVNNLAFFINIILFVARVIAYAVVNILCILGMVKNPMEWNGKIYEPNWLMEIFIWISQNLQIPYITNP